MPTGAGVRLVNRMDDGALEVRRPNGTLQARLEHAAASGSYIGRSDGSVLVAGEPERPGRSPWTNPLIRVTAGGKVSRVRDARGRLVTGQPAAAVRGGVLLSSYASQTQFSLLTDRGRVVGRDVHDLKLPWSRACLKQGQMRSLSWATAGASGNPVVGVECFKDADRTYESFGSFTVGLDARLHARWIVEGLAKPLTGADGRMYAMNDGVLSAWREPGAAAPRRGRAVSVRKSGGGAVVTIRCSASVGSVCAGTAHLTRGGSKATTVRYALRGQPGKSAAVIRRHFRALPQGSGRLRVTLAR